MERKRPINFTRWIAILIFLTGLAVVCSCELIETAKGPVYPEPDTTTIPVDTTRV